MADGLLLEDLTPVAQDSPDDIARLRMALASASSCLADIVNEVAVDDDGIESLDFARSKVATLTSQVEQLTTEKAMLVESLSEAHRALQEARKLLHEKGIDFPGDLPIGKRGSIANTGEADDPVRDKWHQELEGAQHVIQDLQAQNRMLEDKLGAAKSQLEGRGVDPDIVLELHKSKAREAELLTELSVMQSARDELIAKEQKREEAMRLGAAGESLGSANFTVESLQSKVKELEAVVDDNMQELSRLKQQQKDIVAPPKNEIELQSEIMALKQELQAARDLLESSTRMRASVVEELHSVQSSGHAQQGKLQSQLHEAEAGLAATKGLFEDEMALLKQQLAASQVEVAALKSAQRGGPGSRINLTPESMDAGHQLEIESEKLSLSEKRVVQLEAKNKALEEKLGALTGTTTPTAKAPPNATGSTPKLTNSAGPAGGLVTVDAAELSKLRWELKTRKKAHLAWEGERELLQGDIVALKAELERIQASSTAEGGNKSTAPPPPMVEASSGNNPGLEEELRQVKAELRRSEAELEAMQAQLEAMQAQLDDVARNDAGELAVTDDPAGGPCGNSKCSAQKTALRLEVSQLKDELAAREGTAGDRDKYNQTLTNLKQAAADAGDEVDQLRHEVNALKLENEKLKKAAQERWEQDKADHHSKKGKMNRIAELKVRELEAELNNVRQQYLAEKEQVQSAAKKLEKENQSLKRQQERRGLGALSEGNYIESEPKKLEKENQSLKRQQERRGPGALSEGNDVESEQNLVEQDEQDEEEEPVEAGTMSPTLIGLVDSEDMEQVYEGIQAHYHRTHTTGHSHKLRQMLKRTADKQGDVTQEEAAIGSVDSEDVVEAYKATPGSSTDEWLRTNGANPNQNREALRGMMAKQAVKASSKWGSKNKMLQVKFAKEVKAAEKELVVEARASGWSQKMLNMKVAEAKEEIRAEIENETATLDQTVDKEAINQAFDRLDSNHDGVLARDEFCEGVETAHEATVKASSKWGSKNKMLQVKFAKEVKAAEKELVVEARASGWSQKMLNMKVAEAKEEIRAEIENETATLDQTVDKEAINQAFDRLDSNHDGVLARDEFCEGVETAHKAAAAEHAANPRTDLSLGYSHETLAGDAALETYLEGETAEESELAVPSDKADQTKKHAGAFKGATSKVRAKGRPRPPKAETEDELEFDFAEKGPDEEESGDDITEEPDVVPDTEEPLPSQGQVEPVMSLPHDVDGDTSNNSTVSSSKRSWRGLKAHPSTQKRSLKRPDDNEQEFERMDGNHDGVLDRAEFRQGVTEEQCTPEDQDAAMPRTLSEAQARIRVLEGSLGELGALNIALNEELANAVSDMEAQALALEKFGAASASPGSDPGRGSKGVGAVASSRLDGLETDLYDAMKQHAEDLESLRTKLKVAMVQLERQRLEHTQALGEDDEDCVAIRRGLLHIVTEIELVLSNPGSKGSAKEALSRVQYPAITPGTNPVAEALAAELAAARQALEVLADEQAAFKGPPSISDRDLKIIHAFANLKADLLPN